MPELLDLGHDERSALVLGKPADVVDELAQVAATLHLLGEASRGCRSKLRRELAARSQNVEATVAGGGIEPRPQMLRRLALHELAVSGGEGVLQGVLRLLKRSEQVAAEGEQAAMMALEDRLERRLVAGGRQRGEPPVVESPQGRLPWRLHSHLVLPVSGSERTKPALLPTFVPRVRL